jgi:tetratricopeptide (TPR) repeat protein
LINLKWLWLYIVVPLLLIPLLIIWNYRSPISQHIAQKLTDFQIQLNPPTPTATPSASGFAEKLRNAQQTGQMNSAIEALRGLTQVYPNEEHYHVMLAQMIILRSADVSDPAPAVLEDAAKVGQTAINANPEAADGWIAQALVLDWSGKFQAALPYALHAKDLDGKHPMVLTVLAEIYHDLRKEDLAAKLIDEAITVANSARPVDRATLAHAHYVKALILANTAPQGEDAIREFEEAWRVAISDPPDLTIPASYIALELSLNYMNRGQADRAIEVVAKAMERDKQDPLLQYRMGSIYLNKGNLNEARTYAETCHDLDPNQPRCLRLLGTLLYRDANYQKAAEMFQQLVAMNSKDPNDYLNAALAYYAQNQCDKATSVLQRGMSLAVDPKDQTAFENALRQCGQNSDFQTNTPTPVTQAGSDLSSAKGS